MIESIPNQAFSAEESHKYQMVMATIGALKPELVRSSDGYTFSYTGVGCSIYGSSVTPVGAAYAFYDNFCGRRPH